MKVSAQYSNTRFPIIGCTCAYGIALDAQRLRNTSSQEFTKSLDEAFVILSNSKFIVVDLQLARRRMRSQREKYTGHTSGKIADSLLIESNEILADNLRIN